MEHAKRILAAVALAAALATSVSASVWKCNKSLCKARIIIGCQQFDFPFMYGDVVNTSAGWIVSTSNGWVKLY